MAYLYSDFKKSYSKRGCMGGGAPRMPDPAPVVVQPKPVDPEDPAVKAKTEEAKAKVDKAAKLAKGRSSSVLTSPLGDQSQAQVQKTSVLGQGGPTLATTYA